MKNLDWKEILRREGGSILTILCGLILVLKPDTASVLLSAVAGWALIAAGVAMLIAGFTGEFGIGSVVTGAVLLLSGAWLHRNPLMIASVLGFVVGFLVLRQGLRAMKDAQRSKRNGGLWIPGAVLAVIEVLVGIRLILSPLSISRLVLSIGGLVLIVIGVCNLVAHYRSTRYIPEPGGIIDADE